MEYSLTSSIISGFDRDARPIIYMRPGRENTETSPRQIRHLIYCLYVVLLFLLTVVNVVLTSCLLARSRCALLLM